MDVNWQSFSEFSDLRVPNGRKQDHLLDSFVNLKQYDKLLFYLEANLFTNPPSINPPSAFIITILLSLATLGNYNNVDDIRRELGLSISEQPLNIRAVNILKGLIEVARTNNDADPEDPFQPYKFENADITHLKKQLINSLDFFKEDRFKVLRSRTVKKDYNVNKRQKLDQLEKSDIKKDSQSEIQAQEQWSPKKRLLEKEFVKLTNENNSHNEDVSDDDSDDGIIFQGSADKRSLKILKNDRIDLLLRGERVWSAISWALSCGSSNKQIHKQIWKVWKPVLEIILDILDIELSEIYTKKDSSYNELYELFKETRCIKFFLKAGRYNFPTKISEIILTKYDPRVLPVMNNELNIAKSVHLPNQINSSSKAEIINEDTAALRRKLFFLTLRMGSLVHTQDNSNFYQSQEGLVPDIMEQLKCIFVSDLNYEDVLNFYRLDRNDIEASWKVVFLSDLLICHLVQLTTFIVDRFISSESDWILKKDSFQFIKSLFQNVSYDKKYYNKDEYLDFEKLKSDFSTMSFILFQIFNIWVISSKMKLSDKQFGDLLNQAEIGEKKRINVIKSCKREYEDHELVYLTSLLKEWSSL